MSLNVTTSHRFGGIFGRGGVKWQIPVARAEESVGGVVLRGLLDAERDASEFALVELRDDLAEARESSPRREVEPVEQLVDALVLLHELLKLVLEHLPVVEALEGQHEEVPHRLGRLVAGRLAVFMRHARVRQSGAVEDATDDLSPFRERCEGRRPGRATAAHPL